MTPLKVALIADGDPADPKTNSGVALGLMTALEERDDVEVVARIGTGPRGSLALLNGLLSFRPNREAWKNQYRKGRLATVIRSRLRDRALRSSPNRPDLVIHVRNTYLPCDIPYVNFLDGTASLSQKHWPAWRLSDRSFRRRFTQEKRQFDGAVAVFTAGHHVQDEVVAEYGQPEQKVFAIGGGTNFAETPVPTRPLRDEVTVLFVGMDFERKGGPTLVRAVTAARASVPGLRLTVVGPPEPHTSFDGLSYVNFLGRISDRARLRRVYEEADIFALLSAYEPYGLVLQEAMSAGLPSVVSNVGALPEIIGYGQAGEVTPQGDEAAVAAALVRLATDPGQRRMSGARASELVSEMTWDRVAARMMDGLRMASHTGLTN